MWIQSVECFFFFICSLFTSKDHYIIFVRVVRLMRFLDPFRTCQEESGGLRAIQLQILCLVTNPTLTSPRRWPATTQASALIRCRSRSNTTMTGTARAAGQQSSLKPITPAGPKVKVSFDFQVSRSARFQSKVNTRFSILFAYYVQVLIKCWALCLGLVAGLSGGRENYPVHIRGFKDFSEREHCRFLFLRIRFCFV